MSAGLFIRISSAPSFLVLAAAPARPLVQQAGIVAEWRHLVQQRIDIALLHVGKMKPGFRQGLMAAVDKVEHTAGGRFLIVPQ